MKQICFVIFLFILVTVGYSQSSNEVLLKGKNLVKQGTVIFDDSYLLKARGLFERIALDDINHHMAQYYIALTDYKLAVFYLQKEKLDLVKRSP